MTFSGSSPFTSIPKPIASENSERNVTFPCSDLSVRSCSMLVIGLRPFEL